MYINKSASLITITKPACYYRSGFFFGDFMSKSKKSDGVCQLIGGMFKPHNKESRLCVSVLYRAIADADAPDNRSHKVERDEARAYLLGDGFRRDAEASGLPYDWVRDKLKKYFPWAKLGSTGNHCIA